MRRTAQRLPDDLQGRQPAASSRNESQGGLRSTRSAPRLAIPMSSPRSARRRRPCSISSRATSPSCAVASAPRSIPESMPTSKASAPSNDVSMRRLRRGAPRRRAHGGPEVEQRELSHRGHVDARHGGPCACVRSHRVASVQLSRGFSNTVHTWIGMTMGHHTMSHDTSAGSQATARGRRYLVRHAGCGPSHQARLHERGSRHAARQHAGGVGPRARDYTHPCSRIRS